MTAREEFNKILNSCYAPRVMYNLLSAMANQTGMETIDNTSEKRAIVLDEVNKIISQEETT